MTTSIKEKILKHFHLVEGEKTDKVQQYLEESHHFVAFVKGTPTKESTELLNKYIGALVRETSETKGKAFYNSLEDALWRSDALIFLERMLHYMTGYGTDFESPLYMPEEFIKGTKFVSQPPIFRTLPSEEIFSIIFDYATSGIALNEEMLSFLEEYLSLEESINITKERFREIKNKELRARLLLHLNIEAETFDEYFRILMLKITGSSQPIKSKAFLYSIVSSRCNANEILKSLTNLDEVKIAENYNRYKEYFVAIKRINFDSNPKAGRKIKNFINRVAKLSKKYHKPMEHHFMNMLAYRELRGKDIASLRESDLFKVLRGINYLARFIKDTNSKKDEAIPKIYKIRNGKAWITKKDKPAKESEEIATANLAALIKHLKRTANIKGKKFYIEPNVTYGLPVSEKMFFGNIPYDTIISPPSSDANPIVGVYWHNKDNARDIDLSVSSPDYGTLDWRSATLSMRDMDSNEICYWYSGDVTSAPNGAAEYMYQILPANAYVTVTLFSMVKTGYIDKNEEDKYSFNLRLGYTNNLRLGEKIKSVDMEEASSAVEEIVTFQLNERLTLDTKHSSNIVGYFKGRNFHVGIYNTGKCRVPNSTLELDTTFKAISAETITYNSLIKLLGGIIVKDKGQADYDLSLSSLGKDSLIKPFLTK